MSYYHLLMSPNTRIRSEQERPYSSRRWETNARGSDPAIAPHFNYWFHLYTELVRYPHFNDAARASISASLGDSDFRCLCKIYKCLTIKKPVHYEITSAVCIRRNRGS